MNVHASTIEINPGELDVHPLAELNPPMSAEQFAELLEDIRANGLRVPIVLFAGRILDGRHRLRACLDAGVTPAFRELVGSEDEAAAYALSLETRRHQTPDERREHAQRLHDAGMSLRQIAERLRVSHETVRKDLSAGENVKKLTPERTGERHEPDTGTGDESTPTATEAAPSAPAKPKKPREMTAAALAEVERDDTPVALAAVRDAAALLRQRVRAVVDAGGRIGGALEDELRARGVTLTVRETPDRDYQSGHYYTREDVTGIPALDALLAVLDAAVSAAAARKGVC